MIYKDTPENTLFICKLPDGSAGFREGRTAEEIREIYPGISEAYPLTESMEAELVAAWEGYWKHSREGDEPTARRLLSAIVRNIYKRAKEVNT